MKLLGTFTACCATLALAGCGPSDPRRPITAPSVENAVASPVPAPVVAPPANVVTVPSASGPAPAATLAWDNIKTLPYAMRTGLTAGLATMEQQVDVEIDALKAKRATMTANTQDWDFAMRALETARTNLRSTVTDLKSADVDNYDARKNRVGDALTRVRNAIDRVKLSTTT